MTKSRPDFADPGIGRRIACATTKPDPGRRECPGRGSRLARPRRLCGRCVTETGPLGMTRVRDVDVMEMRGADAGTGWATGLELHNRGRPFAYVVVPFSDQSCGVGNGRRH